MAKRWSNLKLHTRQKMSAAAIQATSKKESSHDSNSYSHPDESEILEHEEMLKVYEDSFDTIFDVE